MMTSISQSPLIFPAPTRSTGSRSTVRDVALHKDRISKTADPALPGRNRTGRTYLSNVTPPPGAACCDQTIHVCRSVDRPREELVCTSGNKHQIWNIGLEKYTSSAKMLDMYED